METTENIIRRERAMLAYLNAETPAERAGIWLDYELAKARR